MTEHLATYLVSLKKKEYDSSSQIGNQHGRAAFFFMLQQETRKAFGVVLLKPLIQF